LINPETGVNRSGVQMGYGIAENQEGRLDLKEDKKVRIPGKNPRKFRWKRGHPGHIAVGRKEELGTKTRSNREGKGRVFPRRNSSPST